MSDPQRTDTERTETESPWAQPQPVDDATLAFPASVVERLMPPYNEIPKEFKNWNNETSWNKLTGRWFFEGLNDVKWDAKPGIDPAVALRHIKTIMRSYEPKHEHKEAAVAYLMSLWFKRVTVGKDVYK